MNGLRADISWNLCVPVMFNGKNFQRRATRILAR